MEPVRIRVPGSSVRVMQIIYGILAVYCVVGGLVLERQLSEPWARRQVAWAHHQRVKVDMVAGISATGYVLAAVFLSRFIKRRAVVLDEQGIRVEGMWSPGRLIAWDDLQEVLTDDKSSVYALLASDHRLNILGYAGKELFAELERRVPLRLEKKTWSTRRYLREAAG